MTVLQRLRTLSAAAGLAVLAGAPALATERPDAWDLLQDAPRVPARQVAMLPPVPRLPAAPQVYAITPERRALLNTIRYAEGTWKNGDDLGYHVIFGGSTVPSLDRHPNRVIRSSRYASAAAGAYQFMPFTWDMVSQAIGLSGFHPQAQDQAAIFLIQRRGALHLIDQGQLTPQIAARLAPEWASFPTIAGYSYYGQPVKRFDDLRRFYEANLAYLRQLETGNYDTRGLPLALSTSTTLQRVAVQSVASQPAEGVLPVVDQGVEP
ncbi:MAG: glycoside hydrolase family 104 protein [Cyanobacteriota bacterium]|nr:glycoside hydrolase family 104 protein [Cyanobacteriota bacterium]